MILHGIIALGFSMAPQKTDEYDPSWDNGVVWSIVGWRGQIKICTSAEASEIFHNGVRPHYMKDWRGVLP